MFHELRDLLRLRGCAVPPVRESIPDVRSCDAALNGEERWTVGVDRADGSVALRMDAVDEEIGHDVLGASGFLSETRVAKAVLFDEGSAVAQVSSNDGGVKERGGRISLVSDDDDRVLQRVVPWTGEPLDSTSGPSVTVMRRLRELTANCTKSIRKGAGKRGVMWCLTHRGDLLDNTCQLIKDSLSGDAVLINGIAASDSLEGVIREFLCGLPPQRRWAQQRATCKSQGRAARLDECLIKLEQCVGSELGPRGRGVESLVDCAYEEDGLEIVVPTRPSVVVGHLFQE